MKHLRRSPSDRWTRATSAGTSMRGPITPARACPDVTPQTPMRTAMASSKLLPPAVKARVAVYGQPRCDRAPATNATPHMIAKWTSIGIAMLTTASGSDVIASPWRTNITTIVNSSP